jgi:TRAP-type C4-dicarboxylate transport system substrate-binding protein
MAMDHQGIMALDITTYGNYGWATTKPVKTIADARKLKFRTAEAAVNQLSYKAWGFNPVAMPWPDVPVALKQGVIDGLDHTLIVCSLTKKFEVAKYFTQLNYAQGLFIWIFNKAWFNNLPPDLQKIFVETVRDVAAEMRAQGRAQEAEEIAKAKAAGIEFNKLSDDEMEELRKLGNVAHEEYEAEINKLYPGDKYRPDNYLMEVQEFMGYGK